MINYAHRGASQYAPENTMSSFRKGIELGATGIECDLRKTKDGKIVICHNRKIDKISSGKGKICDYTYEELLQFDFGSWFAPEYKGEKIVLFEDYAKEFLPKNLTFAIEIKVRGINKKVLGIIKKYAVHDNIYITSFDYRILKNMRRLDKNIKISWLVKEGINEKNIKKIKKIKGNQICPIANLITEKDVEFANANGITVRPWKVKNEEIMERMYKLNIQGMTVNFPDKLRKLMEESKNG